MKTRKKLTYNLNSVLSNIENGTGIGSIKSSNINDDDRPYTPEELPIASGHEAFAWGKKCQALAKRAFAFGNDSKATNNTAVAIGQNLLSQNSGAFVAGIGNVSNREYQAIFGRFADKSGNSDKLFQVGNGTNDANRNDGFAVVAENIGDPAYAIVARTNGNRDDSVVRVDFLKQGLDTKSNATNIENGIGQDSLQQTTAAGGENYAYGLRNFIAGGHKNKTYQYNSTAIGGGNKAGLTEEEFLEKFPSGVDYAGRPYETSYGWAFTFGADNKALANPTFAIGMLNKVESVQDYALGWDNNLKGENQVSIGGYNNSYGLGNLNIGRENRIGDFVQNGVDAYEYPKYEPVNRTSNTIVLGVSNNVYADNSLVTGLYNECLSGNNNIVIGEHNSCNYGERMTLLGHGLKRSFQVGGYDGSDYCVILGTYNAQRSDTSKSGALILGCGTSDTDRKNAFEVYKDGTVKAGKSTTGSDTAKTLTTKDYVTQSIYNATKVTWRDNTESWLEGPGHIFTGTTTISAAQLGDHTDVVIQLPTLESILGVTVSQVDGNVVQNNLKVIWVNNVLTISNTSQASVKVCYIAICGKELD